MRAWACVSCFLELCKILKAGFSPHMCTESFPNPLLKQEERETQARKCGRDKGRNAAAIYRF